MAKPWKDKEKLERMYWDCEMTQQEIANELGCSQTTVQLWMKRLDVEAREFGGHRKRMKHASLGHKNGYERWMSSDFNGKIREVKVHQLLAIADGADPHKIFSNARYQIHHKNTIPWDNRYENIELLTASQHGDKHGEN